MISIVNTFIDKYIYIIIVMLIVIISQKRLGYAAVKKKSVF
jgi:hypothetical protein